MRLASIFRPLRLSWIVLPLLAVMILLIPLPNWNAVPRERLFRVEAGRFAYSPAILRANPGDRITIELEANDVVHGLEIDGYGLNVTADPGQPATLTFLADRSGVFRMRCSVTCGAMHPFMIGKLQVGSNPLLWRGAGLAFLAVFAGLWRIWR